MSIPEFALVSLGTVLVAGILLILEEQQSGVNVNHRLFAE